MAWFITATGFYSVVQKTGTDYLTVRARVRSDLDNLRKQYMPTLSKTIVNAGTDYEFRATISHNDFANGMKKVVMDIDYGNFKNAVSERISWKRAEVYGNVWSELLFGLSRS